jgi:hypothetical protein
MDVISKEVEKYKYHLLFFSYFLKLQVDNEQYILDLIKGDNLPEVERAIRSMIESFEDK